MTCPPAVVAYFTGGPAGEPYPSAAQEGTGVLRALDTLVCVNVEWALAELERHRSLLGYRDPPGLYRATYVGTDDEIAAQQVVVERIWGRVLGPTAESEPDAYDPRRHERERTVRCIESIKRNAEIRLNLGDEAPELNAKSLHPWVWDGARSLWQSNHFAEAVEAAAKRLNAQMQSKLGRRDVSEATLFQQGFSDDPPQPGRPRLRLPDDDDGTSARAAFGAESAPSRRAATQLCATHRRTTAWNSARPKLWNVLRH